MAAGSLLALIDDIASVLDDVALLTKVAAKKTSGVLGDDLAVNAEQVAGVNADRELPVIWAVAKGSFRNKAILVPAALLISAVLPWLVTPLLMAGGAFLCFEGVEKVLHAFAHRQGHPGEKADTPSKAEFISEEEKIKGAIRTDLVLSGEIIAITLGTVAASSLLTRALVLSGVAVLMTVGVYGVVAAIVKLDDAGLYLAQKSKNGPLNLLGNALLKAAPLLMKFLGVAGTLAMFMVGGGIITHGFHGLKLWMETLPQFPGMQSLLDALVGFLVGVLCVAGVKGIQSIQSMIKSARR